MEKIHVDKKGSVHLGRSEEQKSEITVSSVQPKKNSGKIIKVSEESQKVGLFRRMLQTKKLKINSEVNKQGLTLGLKWGSEQRKYHVLFPEELWKEFPEDYKKVVAENISHLSTLDLVIMLNAKKVSFNTPLPLFKSFFMEVLLKCLLYSGDCDTGKTINYITRLTNLETEFKGSPTPLEVKNFETKEGSINTLTFGKESLVSWGLAQELGMNPVAVTIIEPDCDVIYRGQRIQTFQNQHKYDLIKKFEKEFNLHVYCIDSNLNDIADYTLWDLEYTDLGWSAVLTEYLFFLLPFSYHYKHKYVVYGNEYSCDSYYYNKEGFKCLPVYDQSTDWMRQSNTMLQNLTGGGVQAISLVQPLHEIAVTKLLYQRYPHLAKYQMSCHCNNEGAKSRRWCSACSKCARCFIFMKALGFDPALADLNEMLSLEHKHHYSIFNQSKDMCGFDSVGLGRDEQMFAFHLAAKRGVQGELIELFKKEFGEEAERREEELRNEFFKVQRPENIPSSLWRKLKPIYEEELKK